MLELEAKRNINWYSYSSSIMALPKHKLSSWTTHVIRMKKKKQSRHRSRFLAEICTTKATKSWQMLTPKISKELNRTSRWRQEFLSISAPRNWSTGLSNHYIHRENFPQHQRKLQQAKSRSNISITSIWTESTVLQGMKVWYDHLTIYENVNKLKNSHHPYTTANHNQKTH